jgi:IMP cyclohydrolase
MNAFPALEKLTSNPYPGRGIICGASGDGKKVFQVYWIMGRSASSRNRSFTAEGASVKTDLITPVPGQDTSLIVYHPVRQYGDIHIVTNGDQTDTILNGMTEGKTFEQALLTRKYEHDAPHYTPRISAVINLNSPTAFSLSIIKNTGDETAGHFFYNYDKWLPGRGRFISTYTGDGNPLPPWDGEPVELPLQPSAQENLDFYWDRINEANKVSILVKEIDLADRSCKILIKNKY